MKRLFIFILITFSFSAINTIFSQTENVTIKGKLINNIYTQIYLDNVLNDIEIASATINSDEFEFKIYIERADYYRLRLDNNVYLILILAPNEIVSVEYDINNSYSSKVTGSSGSALFYDAYSGIDVFTKKLAEYTVQIEKEKKEYYKKVIEENPKSLASIIFIDELDIETYFETYKMLAENMQEYYEYNSYVKQFIDKFNSLKNTSIGATAPDINLEDQNGKFIKLSSIEAEYILIDFWASWCKPCRIESPYLVLAYETYNAKGFNIYSVSLDQKKEDWIAAITADNLGDWTHVSDLKYWNCEPAGVYGVKSIPANFLIDKDGKIIAKDLRGEELLAKLAELLK
jgi:peroxiredoxin/intracellular septation protein A